ncbi:DUF4156 domain-containing protein [Morganella morganii]|nr:DUF4156 domain-containing protein [Morganella morganii]
MRIKMLPGALALLLLAGCTTTTGLSSAGSQVRFSEEQPPAECQKLGEVTGVQSNWMTGVGNESSSMRGAANDLRNKAAAMGGNVIYGLGSPAESAIVSSLIPVDSKLTGQVFKCP